MPRCCWRPGSLAIAPQEEGGHLLTTSAGQIAATYVVNAAGLRSDEVDRLFGHHGFTVTPRRGELIVFDKLARSLVSHILLPVPTARGKGVLVAPTVYGNVMLGPTADDLDDKTATGTTEAGLEALRRQGSRIMPALLDEEVTTTYAGLRAATEHADYQVELHADQGYVCVGGVRSTGLTASMAIAEHVRELMAGVGWVTGPARDVTCRRPCRTSARPSRGPTPDPSWWRPTPTTAGSSATASA